MRRSPRYFARAGLAGILAACSALFACGDDETRNFTGSSAGGGSTTTGVTGGSAGAPSTGGGGTTSIGGAGGTVSVGSTGGGGPAPPDCLACGASHAQCAQAVAACQNNAMCSPWFTCMNECYQNDWSTPCFEACNRAHPEAHDYFAPVYEKCCASCQMECDLQCEAAPIP